MVRSVQQQLNVGAGHALLAGGGHAPGVLDGTLYTHTAFAGHVGEGQVEHPGVIQGKGDRSPRGLCPLPANKHERRSRMPYPPAMVRHPML